MRRKTIHGGAAFVWPLIQDYAFMSLDPIQIEIPLRGALSSENIRVNVPSVFTVADRHGTGGHAAGGDPLAGTVDSARFDKQAEEIIFGQLRQVIASMGIEEINRDRDTFLQHIQESLEPELNKIGLQLINVNITDITDESGYIDAIGQKAASQAIQQARADVADEERKGETRVAGPNATRRFRSPTPTAIKSIGTREAERDQAIRVADLEKEQAVGEQAGGVRTAVAGQGLRAARCVLKSPTPTRPRSTAKTSRRPRSPLRRPNWRSAAPKPTSWAKAANARPRPRCWRSRTAPWPRPRWPKPNESRPKSEPSWKLRPALQGQDDRRRRGGSRETPHRGPGRSRCDLRQAGCRSPR